MDINTICLTGRIFDIRVCPTKGLYPVVEAKLSVNVGTDKISLESMFDEFNIRSYGKKSLKIAEIKPGTFVSVQGRLKEDIRVNALEPDTVRSKTYINIDSLKAFNVED